MILTPLQKLTKNVEDLGKLIVANAVKSYPKSNKSPNLVTLLGSKYVITNVLSTSNNGNLMVLDKKFCSIGP